MDNVLHFPPKSHISTPEDGRGEKSLRVKGARKEHFVLNNPNRRRSPSLDIVHGLTLALFPNETNNPSLLSEIADFKRTVLQFSNSTGLKPVFTNSIITKERDCLRVVPLVFDFCRKKDPLFTYSSSSENLSNIFRKQEFVGKLNDHTMLVPSFYLESRLLHDLKSGIITVIGLWTGEKIFNSKYDVLSDIQKGYPTIEKLSACLCRGLCSEQNAFQSKLLTS